MVRPIVKESLPPPALSQYQLKRASNKPGIPALERFRLLCGSQVVTDPITSPSIHPGSLINEHHLSILFDWMCDVRQHFGLQGDVLNLAIHLTRQHVEHCVVVPRELQLVGCAAVWIASKKFDFERPFGREILGFVNHAYTISDLKRMERTILKVVRFHLDHITEWTYRMLLTRACTESPQGVSSVQVHMADYFLWIAITCARSVSYHPALVVISAHIAAAHVLNHAPPEAVQWLIESEIHNGPIPLTQLHACVQLLLHIAAAYSNEARWNASKRSLAQLHASTRFSQVSSRFDATLSVGTDRFFQHASPSQFAPMTLTR